MKQQDRGDLKFLILFSAIIATSSFLFSFLSWGLAIHRIPILENKQGILIELVEHAAVGALVALPTRRKVAILTCALGAMLIDVDHIGALVGLPTDARASHAVTFAVVVVPVIFSLARKGIFGQQPRPLFVASLALASFIAHLAWDAIYGGADFPLWMPFSNRLVFVPPFGGVLLAITAALLLWGASAVQQRQTQPKHIHTES